MQTRQSEKKLERAFPLTNPKLESRETFAWGPCVHLDPASEKLKQEISPELWGAMGQALLPSDKASSGQGLRWPLVSYSDLQCGVAATWLLPLPNPVQCPPGQISLGTGLGRELGEQFQLS